MNAHIKLPSPPSSLAIVKPGSLGDVIHALPVASAIKEHWPDCSITWVIDERWTEIFSGNPDVTHLVVFPRQKFRGLGILRALPWASHLSKIRPDCVIDLQGLLRSALISRALLPKKVIGLSDAREGARMFYHHVVPVNPGHSVTRYLSALHGLALPLPENPVFKLPLGSLPPGIKTHNPIIIHPFARGKAKSLTHEHLALLLDLLHPNPVILVGSSGNFSTPHNHVTNLLGKTKLLELIGLLRSAKFVISVDSGPAHLADALGVPLIAIHTWSDPVSVGPFSKGSFVWQAGRIMPTRQVQGARPAQPTPKDILEISQFVLKQTNGMPPPPPPHKLD